VLIRPETPEDYTVIAALCEAAFEGFEEVRIIEEIRDSDGYVPELALVAEDEGQVVGHVLVSYVGLEGSGRRLLELGPLAVRPDRQRGGIGSELVRTALAIADARGEPLVLVLGHPEYYPRFGFRRASELGLERPTSRIPDEAFMAVPLARYDPGIRGRIVFPPAFS
jgi:putative acetyltransferase